MKPITFRFILVIAIVMLAAGSGGMAARAEGQAQPGGESREGSNSPAMLPDDPAREDPAAGPGLKWYTVSGVAFVPNSSAVTWTTPRHGCILPTSTGFWRASLNLPDGAIMKQFYFGYYNTPGSAVSTASIYRYNYTGAADAVVYTNSTPGTTAIGFLYVGASIADVEAVNYTNSYVFMWQGSTTQELCYIQVGYVPPSIFGTALPMLQKGP